MRFFLGVAGAVALALAGGSHPHVHALGHAEPGGGYTADVFVHRGYAYLGSWHGDSCPSQGVRVYSLASPAKPRERP